MPPIKAPVNTLADFLPAGAFPLVAPYFNHHTIQLTLTKERNSILGNYRNPIHAQQPHKISINGNLNPYSFLITLLHEIAHLVTYTQFKHTVAPHGTEWKNNFKHILHPFLLQHIFPTDIANALHNYCNQVKASTCGDPMLYKTLKNYDKKTENVFIETLPLLSFFKTKDGSIYQILEKRRTRYTCMHIASQKKYLFPGIYEVSIIVNI